MACSPAGSGATSARAPTTLWTWFFAVGYFFARHEISQELRGVENKLDALDHELDNAVRAIGSKFDTLISELELRVGQAVEDIREGRGFPPPSDSGPLQ
jgi:hypothetical protein